MRTIAGGLCALLISGAAAGADAQRRRGGQNAEAAAAAATTAAIEEGSRLLASASPDEIRQGIESLGATGSPRAVQPLAERILRGLPNDLLDAAMDALVILARPESGALLFELASHRRATVRLQAVSAIISARPRGADRALATALSDSDARVRGTAATGLGQIGGRSAIDALFLAFDRGILESATSIGQLATAEEITRLLGYLGRMPFDAVAPALNEVLARRDVPERSKLDVIARLHELATPEVKTFLQEFVASLPEDPRGRDPIRRAAEEAILRIAG